MSALAKWQRDFATAIFGEVLVPQLKTRSISSQTATSIYRNNVYSNLVAGLGQIYTAVEKLVGSPFFSQIARAYVEIVPSRSGDMNRYGEGFADYLATLPALANLPYITDMAKLEWYCHLAYGAPDFHMITEPNDSMPTGHFGLNPAAYFLSSRYPLKVIWDLCAGDGTATPISLDTGPSYLLIYRVVSEVVLVPLSRDIYDLVHSVLAGESSARVMAHVSESVQAEWVELIRYGVLVQFSANSR